MVKAKERDLPKEDDIFIQKKIMESPVRIFADVKLLLAGLLVISCLLATASQLLPYKSIFSTSDLRSVLTKLSTTTTTTTTPPSVPPPLNLSLADGASLMKKESSDNSSSVVVVKRGFSSFGSAAYLFVQMGAYRGGLNTFAVVGLASKPIHVYSKPEFRCDWVPHNNRSAAVSATSSKFLPDWGYGRVYTVVVVNCTFATDVGADGSGGELVITATTGGGDDASKNNEEKFVAIQETPGTVNASLFTSPPKYDYLYCGSPLYGDLSPQRVREWMAYHASLFGKRSHFVIYDAGGIHPEVMDVLRAWIEKGIVTLQDVREEEMFDGYYHNQFLIVNDCLHRYRFYAKWMFFFDIDEFIYVHPRIKLDGLMNALSGFTQFTIQQMPMSSKLCLSNEKGETARMWGIEKLVYRDVKRGIRRDRKYAIQPRNAFTAGVHLSQNFEGKTTHKTEGKIKYFHYHGTIANRQEPCKEFVNATELWYEGTPYYRDETLRRIAAWIKKFEQRSIGERLVRTRQ